MVGERSKNTKVIKKESVFSLSVDLTANNFFKKLPHFSSQKHCKKSLNSELIGVNGPKSIRVSANVSNPLKIQTEANPEIPVKYYSNMQAKPTGSLKSYKLLKLLGRSYVLEDQLTSFTKGRGSIRRNQT